MKNKGASITLDDETLQIAEKLAKRSNKSIPDTIKDLIKREKDISDYRITKGVRKISGILKTNYDYKTLRDMCVAENVERFPKERD